jgi:opacity protein-like surface antigen
MRRSTALMLSCAAVALAASARAETLPPSPPLDVSGWYLRGNVDAAPQATEGQTRLQPNLLSDVTKGSTPPSHFSMIEIR